MQHNYLAPAHEAAVDPICGMTVEPASAAARRDYESSTYYFCSTHCAAEFDTNPAEFANR